MIISRLIPSDTKRYEKARAWISNVDWLFLVRWELFFGLWAILLSGFSLAVMQDDRYLYWYTELGLQATLMFTGFTLVLAGLFGFCNLRKIEDTDSIPSWISKLLWCFAVVGLICLVFAKPLILIPVTLIVFLLGPLTGYRPLDLSQRSLVQIPIYFALAYLLFLTGWFFKGGQLITGFWIGFPYSLAFMALFIVYRIPIEYTSEKIPVKLSNNRRRIPLLILAFVLILAATILGYWNDDPVISTAACVYLPFLLVALVFPPHYRHILRCRIYPVFILTMLVAVRYPWFLLPLGLNFWILRSYTYLRYGFQKPTFRVDYD